MGEMLKKLFTQRKWFVAILSAAVVLLNKKFGLDLDAESIYMFLAPIMAVILGESYKDGQAFANGHVQPPKP